jgi:Putative transposase of IS4/5 family (DUF4096)
MREIVNGIFYVMRAGCPWRLLPNDLPPWGTIYRWFAAWRDDGRFERINHALVMADRERVGRDANPSAAIIDSQSVKTTEAGGPLLRCGQESQRAQAPRARRHRRPDFKCGSPPLSGAGVVKRSSVPCNPTVQTFDEASDQSHGRSGLIRRPTA